MSQWEPIHFLTTADPHKDGTTVTTDCGEILANAVAVAIWEHGEPVKKLKQTSLFCRSCCAPINHLSGHHPRNRYLYALMERDEAIRRGLIGEAAEVLS